MNAYTPLTTNTNDIQVSLTLTLGQIKILNNACIDILNKYPEMISYQEVQKNLNEIIIDVSKKLS